jgi:hypothetical protein
MESTINRGRAHECPYCFYKAELRKLKEQVGLTHAPLENHQFQYWMDTMTIYPLAFINYSGKP